MKKKSLIYRLISFFLSAVLFLDSGSGTLSASASIPPSSLPARVPFAEAPQSSRFPDLPPEIGTLESLSESEGPVLVHIQTAHGHEEAQRNIGSILSYLKNEAGITTVLVEGSAHELDPSRLDFEKNYPGQGQEILENLLKKGWLKGPELFLLEEKSARVVGIEDQTAYVANGLSFQRVLEARGRSERYLAGLDMQIERLLAAYLPSGARELLKQYEAWEAGRLSLGEWIRILSEASAKYLDFDPADPASQMDYPMIGRLAVLLSMEQKLDAEAYETERAAFEALLSGLPEEVSRPVRELLSLPLGQTPARSLNPGHTFERFAAALPDLEALKKFPQVMLRVRGLVLQSELDASGLSEETRRLSKKVFYAAAGSEEAARFLRVFEDYRLLVKLFSLEALPAEVDSLLEREEELRPERLAERFKALNSGGLVRDLEFTHLPEIEDLLDASLDFYRGARERDGQMIQNIETLLKERGIEKAAVVTGGFHARPFQDYFVSKGYAFARVTPFMAGPGSRDTYVRAAFDLGLKFSSSATWETPYLSDPAFVMPEMPFKTQRSELRSDVAARALSESGQAVTFRFLGGKGGLTPDEREQLFQWAEASGHFQSPRIWNGTTRNVLIAYVNGQIAGVQAYRRYWGNELVHAEGLYVAPEYRRGGLKLGTRLRDELLQRFKRSQISTFLVPVAKNVEAQNFHQAWIKKMGGAVENVLFREDEPSLISWIFVNIAKVPEPSSAPLEDAPPILLAPDGSRIEWPGDFFSNPEERSELRSSEESLTAFPKVDFRVYASFDPGSPERKEIEQALQAWDYKINFNEWNGSRANALVAYVDGKPAGIQAYGLMDWSRTAETQGLFVAPEFRRSGLKLATRLRLRLMEMLKSWGYHTLIVEAAATAEAQGFHLAWIREMGDAVEEVKIRKRDKLHPIEEIEIDLTKTGAARKPEAVASARSELRAGDENKDPRTASLPPVTFRYFDGENGLSAEEKKELLPWLVESKHFPRHENWNGQGENALIAYVDGKVAGAQAFYYKEDESWLQANGLFVAPEFRRTGLNLAMRLRDELLMNFKQRGADGFETDVSPNPEAQAFHWAWISSLGEALGEISYRDDEPTLLEYVWVDLEKYPDTSSSPPQNTPVLLASASQNPAWQEKEFIQNRSELRSADREGLKLLSELLVLPPGTVWTEHAEKIQALKDKKLGRTYANGQILFSPVPGFPYRWPVLGYHGKDWEASVTDTRAEANFFEFEVTLTREGQEPVKRLFQVGSRLHTLAGSTAHKGETRQVLEISDALGLRHIGDMILQPPGYDWKAHASEMPDLRGLKLGKVDPRNGIPLTPVTGYTYDWHLLGKIEDGWSAEIEQVLYEKNLAEITVLFTHPSMPPFSRRFQIGSRTRSVPGSGGRFKDTQRDFLAISPHLGLDYVAEAMAKPADFDWRTLKDEWPDVRGLRLGVTNESGQIGVVPEPYYHYGWPVLGLSEAGWEARLGTPVFHEKYIEFEVFLVKAVYPVRRRVFQIGSLPRMVQGSMALKGREKQFHDISAKLGHHILSSLLQDRPGEDFLSRRSEVEDLEGLLLGKLNHSHQLHLHPYEHYGFLWQAMPRERGTGETWSASIVSASVLNADSFQFQVIFTHPDHPAEIRSYQAGPGKVLVQGKLAEAGHRKFIYRIVNLNVLSAMTDQPEVQQKFSSWFNFRTESGEAVDSSPSPDYNAEWNEVISAFQEIVDQMPENLRPIAQEIGSGAEDEQIIEMLGAKAEDIQAAREILRQRMTKVVFSGGVRSELRSAGGRPSEIPDAGSAKVDFRLFAASGMTEQERIEMIHALREWNYYENYYEWNGRRRNALLVYVNGRLAGAQAFKFGENRKFVSAEGLFIAPEFRRKGLRLAFRLRDEWLTQLKLQGVTLVHIPVDSSESAQGFHRAWAERMKDAIEETGYPFDETSEPVSWLRVDLTKFKIPALEDMPPMLVPFEDYSETARSELRSFEVFFQEALRNPIELTEAEVKEYFGEAVGEKVQKGEVRYFLRRLEPQDQSFLEEWEEEFDQDAAWKEKRTGRDEWFEAFPGFLDLRPLSVGLVSVRDGVEKLEGHLGADVASQEDAAAEETILGAVKLSQIEVYYRNRGRDGELKGIANVLVDYLLKITADPLSGIEQGFMMTTVTPGSDALAERYRMVRGAGELRFLGQSEVEQYAASRNLAEKFNPRPEEKTAALSETESEDNLRSLDSLTAYYFKNDIELTFAEIARYLGSDAAERAAREGIRYFIKRLFNWRDAHYLKDWGADYQADLAWQKKWKEKIGDQFDPHETFPHFSRYSDLAFGLVSLKNGQERLEGQIGFESEYREFDAVTNRWMTYLHIAAMETYYRHRGEEGDLRGVSDVLMSVLLKIATDPSSMVRHGLGLTAMTPGGSRVADRYGMKETSGGHRYLTQEQMVQLAESLGVAGQFNTARSELRSFDEIYSGALPSPIELSYEEQVRYFGDEAAEKARALGTRYFLRRLDPEKDREFIDQWQVLHHTDTAWQQEWDKKGFWADRLPRFGYISFYNAGLVSVTNGSERLEGFVGIQPSLTGYDYEKKQWTFSLGIEQMELFYRNIGRSGDLRGVSNVLMDFLLKFAAEPSNRVRDVIEMNAVTPGSQSLAERYGFAFEGDLHYVLSKQAAVDLAQSRNLSAAFEGRQDGRSELRAEEKESEKPILNPAELVFLAALAKLQDEHFPEDARAEETKDGMFLPSDPFMTVQILKEVLKGGEHLIDLGSGSGVVLFLAAALGASKATGYESDSGLFRASRHMLSKLSEDPRLLFVFNPEKIRILKRNYMAANLASAGDVKDPSKNVYYYFDLSSAAQMFEKDKFLAKLQKLPVGSRLVVHFRQELTDEDLSFLELEQVIPHGSLNTYVYRVPPKGKALKKAGRDPEASSPSRSELRGAAEVSQAEGRVETLLEKWERSSVGMFSALALFAKQFEIGPGDKVLSVGTGTDPFYGISLALRGAQVESITLDPRFQEHESMFVSTYITTIRAEKGNYTVNPAGSYLDFPVEPDSQKVVFFFNVLDDPMTRVQGELIQRFLTDVADGGLLIGSVLIPDYYLKAVEQIKTAAQARGYRIEDAPYFIPRSTGGTQYPFAYRIYKQPLAEQRSELRTAAALAETRLYYEQIRAWMLSPEDRRLQPADQAAFLGLLLDRPVYSELAGLLPETFERLLPESARGSAAYQEQLASAVSGGGRVLFDGRWLLEWGKKNPRGLFLLLNALEPLSARQGEPLAAVTGDEKLFDEISRALLQKENGLSAEENVRARELSEGGRLASILERVSEDQVETYTKRHQGGVAALHEGGALFETLAANFVLDAGETVHKNDELAAAFLLPALFKAASLIRGIGEPAAQRDLLTGKLHEILPGSQMAGNTIAVHLREFITQSLIASRLIDQAA